MAHTDASAKVGAVVIVALLLMGAIVYFFVGRGAGGYPVTVTFQDAQGIKQQADVRLAGVKIGVVQGIDVDPSGGRAVLHLRIYRDRRIPVGSTYTITSGGLLGEMFVQITSPQGKRLAGRFLPTTGPEPVIEGKDLPTFDQLKEQVANLTTGSQDILADLRKTTQSMARITGDRELQHALKDTVLNARDISAQGIVVTRQINATVRQVTATVDRELPVLTATMENVRLLTQDARPMVKHVDAVTQQASRLVAELRETNVTLTGLVQDVVSGSNAQQSLKTTLEGIAAASKHFEAIAASAQKIVDDLASKGESTSKVGQTMVAVQATAERANKLLDKLTGVAGSAGKGGVRGLRGAAEVDFSERTRGKDPFGVDLTLGVVRGRNAAIVGLQHLGDGNRLRLQSVVSAGEHLKYVYGFQNSKLGIGVDYTLRGSTPLPSLMDPPGTTALSLNVSDPNNARLDLRLRRQFSTKLGAYAGVEDATDHPTPVVGLTYRP